MGLFLNVGILVAIVLMLIYFFTNRVSSSTAFGTGIMALATVALAFFTYWSIRSANEKEDRDRKERYFNEIIDWLTGLEGRLFFSRRNRNAKESVEEFALRTNLEISWEEWQNIEESAQAGTELSILSAEIAKGEYLQKLANALDKPLAELLTIVLTQLKSRRQIDMDWLFIEHDSEPITDEDLKLQDDFIKNETKPLENVKKELSLHIIKLGRLRNAISTSVLTTITKAVENKARLLKNAN